MKTSELILIRFPKAMKEEIKYFDELAPLKGLKKVKNAFEFISFYFGDKMGVTQESVTKSGVIQCEANKSRSFLDLFAMARVYLPKLQFPEFTNALLEFQQDGDLNFAISFCSNTGKIVMKHHPILNFIMPPHFIKNSNGLWSRGPNSMCVSDLDIIIKKTRKKIAKDAVFEVDILNAANEHITEQMNKIIKS